jgi:hypothetical protein
MSALTSSGRQASGRPLKSPLALAGHAAGNASQPFADDEPALIQGVVLSDREATLAEFQGYLRTVNNRVGRPSKKRRSRPTPIRPRTSTGG